MKNLCQVNEENEKLVSIQARANTREKLRLLAKAKREPMCKILEQNIDRQFKAFFKQNIPYGTK